MNYKKLIGYGVLIWVIVFAVVSAFIAFDIPSDNLFVNLVSLIAIIIATWFLAKNLKVKTQKEMIKYSLAWLIIAIILDLIVSVQFTGFGLFGRWHVLFGYLLILIVPLSCCNNKKA